MMHSLPRLLALSFVTLLMALAFSSQRVALAQVEDDVVINEFNVNPNVGKEYVELLVTNPSGVNMQSWTVSDVAQRATATGSTEGDVTLPASASYLSNVPQGTHVVIVFTTPSTNANILAEDTSTADGNNRLVLIIGTTTGLTTAGTIDNATADNLQVYAGTRAAGTLIDQVLVGNNNTSYITGATWGDNNGATTTDNINAPSASVPSNCAVRFVPTANTLSGFQDNDTGSRYVVDANSYGSPGLRNAGVRSETAVGGAAAPAPTIARFDSDAKGDVSVWRSDERNWYIINSSDSTLTTRIDWGASSLGDIGVPRDYDGDGKTDIAVYRPSEGNFYIVKSSDGLAIVKNWGGGSDVPVPADYDGDGKTDVAVFRPSEGNWYILNSATNTVTVRGWGASTDKVAPADYDGDGKADIAVYRPSEGKWYVVSSYLGIVITKVWGVSTDLLAPADYDGDGYTDVAVFRPAEGNWYNLKSGGGVSVTNWGASTDKLVPADYDGDGLTDIAVYRPSEGNWYILRSSDSTMVITLLSGDHPVPNTYLPQ